MNYFRTIKAYLKAAWQEFTSKTPPPPPLAKTLAEAENKFYPDYKWQKSDLRKGVYIKTKHSSKHLMITNVYRNVKQKPIKAVEVSPGFNPIKKTGWKNLFKKTETAMQQEKDDQGNITYKKIKGVTTDILGTNLFISTKDIIYVLKPRIKDNGPTGRK